MLKLPVKTVFEASHNSDGTEGRGHKVIDGYFTTREEALKAVKGMGVWGRDGDITEVTPMVVFETFEEYTVLKAVDIRAEALKKLSVEEQKALGLWVKEPKEESSKGVTRLFHSNNWESHEFYLDGAKEKLTARQLSKIKEVFVDGEKFEARTAQVTGHYTDHGHPGSATSTILQIKMNRAAVSYWVPLHEFIDNKRVVEVLL